MKKGSGGRITSLTLERRGGWEGGREREGWLGDATRSAAARAAAGSGRLMAGPGEAEGGGVANQSEAGGGGGSSPHCARSSCRRRLDPAAMAAAVAAKAAPFRPQAAAPRLLPIRRGHGNPATASVPRGPLPRPRPGTAGLRPSLLLSGCSGSVRAVPRARSPVSGCRAGSSSLPSFLCHSAQAAATAAAQVRIRPGRGLLCARRAVCAAA